MTEESQHDVWPLPKFFFSVILDGNKFPFQEVSGLEGDNPIPEYRDGDSPNFLNTKMPKISKYPSVFANKGVGAKGAYLDQILNSLNNGKFITRTATISLLDEKGNTITTWTLQNAFIAKMDCSDLRSESNEVVIDAIQIVHEGMTAKYYD
jgi:phage tail-like protein